MLGRLTKAKMNKAEMGWPLVYMLYKVTGSARDVLSPIKPSASSFLPWSFSYATAKIASIKSWKNYFCTPLAHKSTTKLFNDTHTCRVPVSGTTKAERSEKVAK